MKNNCGRDRGCCGAGRSRDGVLAAGVTVESEVWFFCMVDHRFSAENRPEVDAHAGMVA